MRAYMAALEWLSAPANRPRAVDILTRHVGGMTEALAAATSARLLDPREGFQPRAALDLAGVGTVLALRSRYGKPQRQLTEPARYVDLSWYARALA